VTPVSSLAVPPRLIVGSVVVNVGLLVGEVIVTVGGVMSPGVYVTVSVSVDELPAASNAVTVIWLTPSCKVIEATDQLSVPEAVPEPPRSLCSASAAYPCSATEPRPSQTMARRQQDAANNYPQSLQVPMLLRS